MLGLPQELIFLREISPGEPKSPYSSQEPLQKPKNKQTNKQTKTQKQQLPPPKKNQGDILLSCPSVSNVGIIGHRNV